MRLSRMAVVFVLLFLTGAAHAVANAAPCTPAASDLDQAYRSMYNLEFPAALQQLQRWERDHPADPLGPVSEAASYLFSELNRLGSLQSQLFVDDDEFDNRKRLAPDGSIKMLFDAKIDRALSLADQQLKTTAGATNALFSNAMAYGLKADYAALIEKRDLRALSYIKQGRHWLEGTIDADPSCYDAYLGLGVENYLLGSRPAVSRMFLRMGGAQVDKAKGIEDLQLTAEKGRLLQPFAKLLLALAALRDRDFLHARALLQELKIQFPHNPLYDEELAKLRLKFQ